MRATLHERLMREAGFETDRDAEYLRHRAARRRALQKAALIGLRLLAFAGVTAFVLERTGHLSSKLYDFGAMAMAVDGVAEWLDKRLEPERAQSGWGATPGGRLVVSVWKLVVRLRNRTARRGVEA